MSVPRLYSFRKLKQKAQKINIEWIPCRGKGGHGIFKGKDINGHIRSYPLPSSQHKREITSTYLKGFLRRFGLDEDFLQD